MTVVNGWTVLSPSADSRLVYVATDGNDAEAENNKIKLVKLLKKNGFTDEELPEIDSVIVFTDKNANLTIIEPTIPILRGNELKTYLREHDKQHNISAQTRSRLIEIFGGEYVTEVTTV